MVQLPAAAAAAAAGHSVVAVATSRRLLRLYSHAGRQLAVLALQGQPVALATPGEAGRGSHESGLQLNSHNSHISWQCMAHQVGAGRVGQQHSSLGCKQAGCNCACRIAKSAHQDWID
jgi:hypothetical protein